MSDEALRELERAVRESGTVAARLALARALERVGRKDDALDALGPAIDDAEARREIGRLAPPVRESAGLFFDVRPIVKEPVVKWETKGGSSVGRSERDALLAGPLGVVCQKSDRVVVFDAESGERRFELLGRDSERRRLGPPAISGEVAILRDGRTLRAFDLFTKERLWSDEAPHGAPLTLVQRGLVAHVGVRVVVREFEHSREPPGPTLFEVPLAHSSAARISAAAGVLIVQAHRGADFLVLDVRTGAERWRGQGFFWMSDERGLVADREDGSLASYTPAGRVEWTTSGVSYRPWALAPDFIAASSITLQHPHSRDLIEHHVIDRATGVVTTLTTGGPQDTVAVARDVIYVIETSVVSAYRKTGERLWRLDLSSRWPRSGGWQLHPVPAPLSRRLYLLVPPNGWVICLEEPAS